MTSSMSKLLEMFKNLKSDAMPRAPRPPRPTVVSEEDPEQPTEVHVEIEDVDDEEIVIEPEDDIKKKPKKRFFKPKKTYHDDEEVLKPNKEKRDSTSSVNVQATGDVYNIVNSKDVRFGNDYYFSTPSKADNSNKYEEHIEKDNLIMLLMEATIKPDHDYMDYISKNLGKNWRTVFRALGFSDGRIDTVEIDTRDYGVSEARYKLLLEWVNNDDDGTLGGLAKKLWEEGERSAVKSLSAMYKKSRK